MVLEKHSKKISKTLKVITVGSVFFLLLFGAVDLTYRLFNPMLPGFAVLSVISGVFWSLFSVPLCMITLYPAWKLHLLTWWAIAAIASLFSFVLYWQMAMMY